LQACHSDVDGRLRCLVGRRLRDLPLTLALLAALWALASVAAASSRPSSSVPPVAAGPLQVQVGPAQAGQATAVLIDVNLDPSVKLPARVRIPVPPGASIAWAGEILGGPASQDPQRAYTLKTGVGAQYAEFALSVSHDGQLDAALPLVVSGTHATSLVRFVQSVPATSTGFSVRMPADATNTKISPAPVAAPQTNPAGESLYALPTAALAPGASITVSVAYDQGTRPATVSSSNLTALYLVLGIVLVLLVATLAFLVVRQRRPSA